LKCNASSNPGRRAFLQLSGLAALGAYLGPLANTTTPGRRAPHPTHVLHIRSGQVELAPGHIITTTTYDGRLPGPLLRATVGQPLRIDVYNETDSAEQLHWHGQSINDADASFVPAGSLRRMEFTPVRPGLYFYHSNRMAAANLEAGLYSGQAGALLVEPLYRASRRDPEWVVVLKDCEPFIRRTARGCEVGYSSVTINGRLPGHVAPLRANAGDRVLVHVLNASATEPYSLELPGHSFQIVALDGIPVPSPATVTSLQLSPGERISAHLTMSQPSGWIVREPVNATWDYTRFGAGRPPEPDATLKMVLTRHEAARSGFNRWSINGRSFSTADTQPLFRVQYGSRYRLKIHNTSDEIIPVHLERHQLQIVKAGTTPAGILKDVVTIGPRRQVEVDFAADNPGPALFRCTRRLHGDFGLMARVDYT
jgi:FtsP/CotA-like multicopper oxidase with cupredoxin domain